MGKRYLLSTALALGLSVLGCASQKPLIAPAALTVPSPAAPARPEAPTRDLPHVRVETDRVLIDDKPVASLERGKLYRIDPLYETMKARRMESNDHSPGSPYELAVAEEVDGAQLKSAFQTAAFSGWPLALLDLGETSIAVHARLPTPPGIPAPSLELSWPDETLVFVVRSDSVELWRAKSTPRTEPSSEAPPASSSEAQATPPREEPAETLGSVTAENLSRDLPLLLRTACEQGPDCSPAVLYVADDAPFSLVRRALRALTALPTRSAKHEVQFRLSKPGAPGAPPRVRIGATTVSGRLEPAVIQKTIRDSYETLRTCYGAGLGRDPKLTGKVVTRFVIDRDGRVPQAAATDGTTMPDLEVTECVVAHFRGLQFPQPEGGIVTVVYPILFAPE